MEAKLAEAAMIVGMLTFVLFFVTPVSYAQDSSISFKLQNPDDGTFSYNLNVVIPKALGEYYNALSHTFVTDSVFPKFITPYALNPIADCLRNIYPNDEDFANGVLSLVHQIPYEVTTLQYYPVETLLNDKGDCDLFSFLAASIMKSGGLDVTLLHYVTEEHMNVGVCLDDPPQDARTNVYSFEYYNKTYYVAECTSSNWQEGWRVGECPQSLRNAPMIIIMLENCEQTAPWQVFASFEKLQTTTIDMNVSPLLVTQGDTLTLNGQITPALTNQNLTLYVNANGSPWTVLTTVNTQSDGHFTYFWQSNMLGIVGMRATWVGNDQYAGTASETQSTIILPFYLIIFAVVAAVSVIAYILLFFVTRINRDQNRCSTRESAFQ